MGSFFRRYDLGGRGWRTATVSAPFVVQGVLALLLVAVWALGKLPLAAEGGRGERKLLLFSLALSTSTSLVFSGALLLRSPSPGRRGLSLSTAGSSVVVLVGGAIYACLALR